MWKEVPCILQLFITLRPLSWPLEEPCLSLVGHIGSRPQRLDLYNVPAVLENADEPLLIFACIFRTDKYGTTIAVRVSGISLTKMHENLTWCSFKRSAFYLDRFGGRSRQHTDAYGVIRMGQKGMSTLRRVPCTEDHGSVDLPLCFNLLMH